MSKLIGTILPPFKSMIEQYFDILEQFQKEFGTKNKKITVLYQAGDFYEIYGLQYSNGIQTGNAWQISEECGGSTPSKKIAKVYNNPAIDVYMWGFPLKTKDIFFDRAINENGWSVAVVSQMPCANDEKPERKVVGFFTPGANIYTNRESNFLMVIHMERKGSPISKGTTLFAGIASINCITGDNEFIQYPDRASVSDEVIYDEITKMISNKNPSEILFYVDNTTIKLSDDDVCNLFHLNDRNYSVITEIPKEVKNIAFQKNLLGNVYFPLKKPTNIFQKLDLCDYPVCQTTLTLLIKYILERCPDIISRLQLPTVEHRTDTNLVLANNALEQLSIVSNSKNNFTYQRNKPLLTILQRTKTPMGTRLFREHLLNPISDPNKLQKRYNKLSQMIKFLKTTDDKHDKHAKHEQKMNNILRDIGDIKRMHREFHMNKVQVYSIPNIYSTIKNSLELIHLVQSFKVEPALSDLFKSMTPARIASLDKMLDDITKTFDLEKCTNTLEKLENNPFNEGWNAELDELQTTLDTERDIIDILLNKLSEIAKNPKDKDNIIFNKRKNKQLGHYICGTESRVARVKKYLEDGNNIVIGKTVITKDDIWFKPLSRGVIQVITECISCSGSNQITHTYNMRKLLTQLFSEWSDKFITEHNKIMLKLSDYIAKLDLIITSARVSINNGYIIPEVDTSEGDSYLDCTELRHPIAEQLITSVKYIGNDLKIGNNENGVLLYGVNASGKSNFMKSVGVNIIMAQAGFGVSAKSFKYRPFKYLFTRILGNDNLYAGMSSFGVEMNEFKTILRYADKNSIVLGDELCHGTEVHDAVALVASGIINLAKRNCNFIFATHLHQLTKLTQITEIENVVMKHMAVQCEKDKIIYLRKILDGSGPSSYGTAVARSMGLDEDYVVLAEEIRNTLTDDKQQIIGKKSRYNSEKILGKCEVCENTAVDTHHINQQCTADKQGMIDWFSKDAKFNLVALCKKCHISVHKPKPKLEILGYREIGTEILLEYKKNGKSNMI